MLKKFFQNTRKPEGVMGRMMLRMMNRGHEPLAEWGLSHLPLAPTAHVLDAGCGGGANIQALLLRCPEGFAAGIDYSAESVEFSRRKNIEEIGRGRCRIEMADVGNLPFEPDSFDAVTAFETIYFWPDLERAFREIKRVLKPGGYFMIVCESNDPSDTRWTNLIEGMTVYTAGDLKRRLEQSGFSEVKTDQKKEWICVTGLSA